MNFYWKVALGIVLALYLVRGGIYLIAANIKIIAPLVLGYFAYKQMQKAGILGGKSKTGLAEDPTMIEICPDCGRRKDEYGRHRCQA